MEMQTIKKREEMDPKTQWKLEDLYESNAAWEEDFQNLSAMLPQLGQWKETLLSSAQALFDGLQKIDEATKKMERLFVFARMRRDENNANPVYQALTERAGALSVQFASATAFLKPLLLSLPEETLAAYQNECPGLKVYAFFFRSLTRSKAHVLSEKEETLLSMAGEFASGAKNIFTMLNNADLDFGVVHHKGKEYPISHATYLALMQSPDRELRKKAYEALYGEFAAHKNTIAQIYSTNVKKDVFFAKARRYEDCLDRALFPNQVPRNVYTGLIETVHQALPAMHRYMDLRKKMLGLSELAMFDVYAPLVQAKKSYSYEKAVAMVREALAPLGKEYGEILQSAFQNGWVDVYENQGKTSGAYSWGVYGVHPYVLLNHRGDLDSVFTIAHEMGHAMHSHYSNQTQPYPTAEYTIFCAEIASTVNEVLMTQHFLETDQDPELKKYVLNHYLDQFRTTVYRQTMFAEFEMLAHEMAEKGQALTAESLSNVYGELNQAYYGKGVQTDDLISLEWARIPHFYNAYYVYQYATGFSAAVAIASQLGAPGRLEQYLNFLKSGGSDDPIILLEKAGVRLETAVPLCMQAFESALTEFEQIMQNETERKERK